MRNLTRRSFVTRALGGAIAAPAIISTPRANEPLPPFPSLSPGDALLLRPGDSHFAEYQASFNLRTALRPQLRALCKTAKAAGVMVDWCRSNNLPFAVRCGGQVKQKFGRLCFFYSLPRSTSEPDRQAFARTVRQVEEMSVQTCETCGSPGELSNNGGIYLTRCAACF
jgi:hypothetical protein